MEVQERLKKQLERIAITSNGQIPTLRTFAGRQMFLTQNHSALMLLPEYADDDYDEVYDPLADGYGTSKFIVGISLVDGGDVIA